MNKGLARLAALSLGLVLACTATAAVSLVLPLDNGLNVLLAIAKEQVLPGPETRLLEEGPARNAEVLEELARLGPHLWAGTYRTAGPWPDELVLAPEAGFTLYQGSWCGTCAHYVALGKVAAADDSTLKVQIELAEPERSSASWLALDDTLHLVRWGNLVFAVPAKRLADFRAEVADGTSFPSFAFRSLGRPVDGEHPRRPDGEPQAR